jgi:hypothetical protein
MENTFKVGVRNTAAHAGTAVSSVFGARFAADGSSIDVFLLHYPSHIGRLLSKVRFILRLRAYVNV